MIVAGPIARRLALLPAPVRRFASFFGGSAAGLAVDLLTFQLLVLIGAPPGLANVCSSTLATVVVYLLVTRYTFSARAAPHTFVLFVAWYGLNVAVTSTLIELAVTVVGGVPFVWKLCSIPLSFCANYLFSHLLFRWAHAREQRRDQRRAQS